MPSSYHWSINHLFPSNFLQFPESVSEARCPHILFQINFLGRPIPLQPCDVYFSAIVPSTFVFGLEMTYFGVFWCIFKEFHMHIPNTSSVIGNQSDSWRHGESAVLDTCQKVKKVKKIVPVRVCHQLQ